MLDRGIQHFDFLQARFESVKSSLRMRKSMVVNCFDNVLSKRVAAKPHREMKLKKANKYGNSKKAEIVDPAKSVRNTGQSAHSTPQESPEDDQADVGNQAGPSKTHNGIVSESKVTAGVRSGIAEVPTSYLMLHDSELPRVVEAAHMDQESLEQVFEYECDKNYSDLFNSRKCRVQLMTGDDGWKNVGWFG